MTVVEEGEEEELGSAVERVVAKEEAANQGECCERQGVEMEGRL